MRVCSRVPQVWIQIPTLVEFFKQIYVYAQTFRISTTGGGSKRYFSMKLIASFQQRLSFVLSSNKKWIFPCPVCFIGQAHAVSWTYRWLCVKYEISFSTAKKPNLNERTNLTIGTTISIFKYNVGPKSFFCVWSRHSQVLRSTRNTSIALSKPVPMSQIPLSTAQTMATRW